MNAIAVATSCCKRHISLIPQAGCEAGETGRLHRPSEGKYSMQKWAARHRVPGPSLPRGCPLQIHPKPRIPLPLCLKRSFAIAVQDSASVYRDSGRKAFVSTCHGVVLQIDVMQRQAKAIHPVRILDKMADSPCTQVKKTRPRHAPIGNIHPRATNHAIDGIKLISKSEPLPIEYIAVVASRKSKRKSQFAFIHITGPTVPGIGHRVALPAKKPSVGTHRSINSLALRIIGVGKPKSRHEPRQFLADLCVIGEISPLSVGHLVPLAAEAATEHRTWFVAGKGRVEIELRGEVLGEHRILPLNGGRTRNQPPQQPGQKEPSKAWMDNRIHKKSDQ